MRLAHKLLLLSTTVLAAVALNATTASATGPVEVHDELGNHCNPCAIQIQGESRIIQPNGSTASSCEDTLHAELYEDGRGHVTELFNQAHAGGACFAQMCNGVGEPATEVEWPFQIEESSPGGEAMELRLCIDHKGGPNYPGDHCDVDADLVDQGTQRYRFTLNQPCPGGFTVTANWEIEDSIVIEHPLNPIEIHNETGTHCNPCSFAIHGESLLTNAAGTPVAICEDTFHAEVYEDGEGHITEYVNQGHAGLSCPIQACTGIGEPAQEAEWPFQISESAPSQERLEFRLCLDPELNPSSVGLHCDVDASLAAEAGTPHHYEISLMNWPCAGGARLWTANWEIEGSPIEIEHADA